MKLLPVHCLVVQEVAFPILEHSRKFADKAGIDVLTKRSRLSLPNTLPIEYRAWIYYIRGISVFKKNISLYS